MIRKLTLTTIIAAAFVAVTLTSGNFAYAGADNGIASERSDSVTALAAVTTDGLWHEFLFGGPGSFAQDCAGGCVPSSGGNSVDAGNPPWTFNCLGVCDVTVSDAFLNGDQFLLFDFAVPLGATSAVVVNGASCGSDPAICVPDVLSSSGVFPVLQGAHSLTIQTIASPFGGGAAYFNIVTVVQFADVDIKPGSDPNSINTKSKGVVPVAILGSATLDVTDIDVSTLQFAGASPKHDLSDPLVYAAHLQDVNLDGFVDLVSHYPQKDTTVCGQATGEITANLLDGTALSGSDSVRPLHCP